MTASEQRAQANWRFEHGHLLDLRAEAMKAIATYLAELSRAGALAASMHEDEFGSIARTHIENIEQSNRPSIRAEVLEWLE